MVSDAWVSVADRLPAIGRRVRVAGRYTPMDAHGQPRHGFPLACRRQVSGLPWFWDSAQWRGSVGIAWWRDDQP
jgi:hypothetical protein